MLDQTTADQVIAALNQNDLKTFFEQYVSDQVQWTITGTNPLSGTYISKQQFIADPIAKINSKLKDGLKFKVLHTHVAGDTLITEMVGGAEQLNGDPYHNEYCWVMQFKENKIVTVRVYYDDVLVQETVANN